MKYVLLFIVSLVFSLGAKSQFIIAGQHSITDYYYDYNPDTIIGNDCNGTLVPIDMNHDGIVDFALTCQGGCGGNGMQDDFVGITAYNNNQVAFSSTDTCYPAPPSYCPWGVSTLTFSIAKAFSDNDTIHTLDVWNNNRLSYMYLYYYSWNCYEFNARSTSDSSFMIGTRVFANNDTLYGWIRIKNIYSDDYETHFQIQDYACNTGYLDININENKNSLLQVFPNPCKETITIRLLPSVKQCELTLSDITGQVVIRQQIADYETQIKLNSLSKGVYFMKVKDDTTVEVKKIIVE